MILALNELGINPENGVADRSPSGFLTRYGRSCTARTTFSAIRLRPLRCDPTIRPAACASRRIRGNRAQKIFEMGPPATHLYH